jgi:hypothetical protein
VPPLTAFACLPWIELAIQSRSRIRAPLPSKTRESYARDSPAECKAGRQQPRSGSPRGKPQLAHDGRQRSVQIENTGTKQTRPTPSLPPRKEPNQSATLVRHQAKLSHLIPYSLSGRILYQDDCRYQASTRFELQSGGFTACGASVSLGPFVVRAVDFRHPR